MLSDRDLKRCIQNGELSFVPEIYPDQVGPASIDLRLGNVFKIFRRGSLTYIDPKDGLSPNCMEEIVREDHEAFVIHPGTFVLVSTFEYIMVGPALAARVEGKSTLARMGILVHTAGFIDPGYSGVITLELSNLSGLPVRLYPGMFICQIAVHRLSSPAEVPYNLRKKSAYINDKAPGIANTQNLFLMLR